VDSCRGADGTGVLGVLIVAWVNADEGAALEGVATLEASAFEGVATALEGVATLEATAFEGVATALEGVATLEATAFEGVATLERFRARVGVL
jgi:hypothetical protein